MSDLPRSVMDAIRGGTLTVERPRACHTYSVELVRALLDARLLVLMEDHMEVVRDRDEWQAAEWEMMEARNAARAEAARLRKALEHLASRRDDGLIPDWEFFLPECAVEQMRAYAGAALDATEPT